jgi:hypothetical protein
VEKDFSGQVPGTWVGQTWPVPYLSLFFTIFLVFVLLNGSVSAGRLSPLVLTYGWVVRGVNVVLV